MQHMDFLEKRAIDTPIASHDTAPMFESIAAREYKQIHR